jgi:hypothetical protein
VKHHQQIGLWLTPRENPDAVEYLAPMTIAEASTAFSAVNVWVEGRLLERSTWILKHEHVLPRAGDLVVRLYRTALRDRVSLLEVALRGDSADALQSALPPDWLIHGDDGSPTALYLVDPQTDELRYWLDMLLGLGYTWSLAVPEEPVESLSSTDERELKYALQDAAICITEHDGEILQVSIRDEAVAGEILGEM